MNYSIKILEIWESDDKEEILIKPENQVLINFSNQAQENTKWMLEEFNGVEYNPNKEFILDEFYTKNRFILDFSKIFKLKKNGKHQLHRRFFVRLF
jgi:hypothetical protein